MFELLFKYPLTVFTKGRFVFSTGWPGWLLAAAIVAVVALLGLLVWRNRGGLANTRSAIVWALESGLAAVILILLWGPAVSVATLKPQQNIIAVVVDDSRSMSIREEGKTRLQQAVEALNGGVLGGLSEQFQVRLYRFGGSLERIQRLDQLAGASPSTHIGAVLKQVAAEGTGLPIGAVVLMTDGADNSGGIDLETIDEIRRRRIPVHTAGFGKERAERDLEIGDVGLPARALAGSRLSAHVTLRQRGFSGQRARLTASDGGRSLASREITLKDDGEPQIETLSFSAGEAGARALDVAVAPLEGEENARNNSLQRLVNVEALKPRILYLEGEPRWEMKFVRRAAEEDRSLELASILRTTQNKIYRQGIRDPKELEQGFPSTAEELFAYRGLILGSAEVSYFTPAQQELIRQFVDRRGGGLLLLGGRAALADGGYGSSPLADLLPVVLPSRKRTFRRDPAAAELTAAGRDSLICRLEEDPEKNAQRWRKLPALADHQECGQPKPGAVVLAEAVAGGRRFPLLIVENYGRGRTAVFSTGGSWRWQMLQDHADRTHEMFWQQLLRWLVSDAPGEVSLTTPRQVLDDEPRVPLRVEVRDKSFAPALDARVEVRISGPDGAMGFVELGPSSQEPGVYTGEWRAERPGSYLAEAVVSRGGEETGRDVLAFRREDGAAENFRTEQNRELLEKLARETGGEYYRPSDLSRLPSEISYSEAGLTIRETRELWNMPVVFLLLVALRAAAWLLRRRWCIV
jgi:uncharacterized membrane protein